MSDGITKPRSELAQLIGASLPDRVLSADTSVVFVLDGMRCFVYYDGELSSVYDAGEQLMRGARFHHESLMPSSRVARAIEEGLEGREVEPFLVVPRNPENRSQIWQLEILPISSARMSAGHGVIGLLSHAGEQPGGAPLDPLVYAMTLSERLERERLETTQAVAVTMRHEINNALTSLIGNAELILRRVDELDEQTASRVREIARQGRRIQTVLDRLEALTEIRTTTYYGGVQMIELGEEDPDPSKGDTPP